ncbi:MAG: alpha/beta fold hydrolase [Pseudomonadota bacterium]|nr:MAG: alpha/beta fold hydrolase [Pseudomonadota bacterium]
MKRGIVIAGAMLLASCQTVRSNDPNMPANAYLEGKGPPVGVVLCHGRGQHPTWYVVDPLRKGINEQLGYHTLSIQLPTGSVSWSDYGRYFPEAHRNIAAAVRYLKEEKKVEKVYLMGHSMGSRMATSYLAENPNSGVTGFIGVGMRNGGSAPLDSNSNLRGVSLPVLDVYGDGGDAADAVDAVARARTRADILGKTYQQVLIPGADHQFSGHEKEMVLAVVTWLKAQP